MGDEAFQLTELEGEDAARLAVSLDSLEAFRTGEFQKACERLMDTGRQELILDLTRVRHVRSQFVGMIIKLADQASVGDRKLTVIASRRVTQVLGVFAEDVGLGLEVSEAGSPRK
jgi:anti-anti-sigma regulatory factor